MTQLQSETPQGPFMMPPKTLLYKSFLIYGSMGSIGLAVIAFGHKTLTPALGIPAQPKDLLHLLSIGVLGAGVLLTLSYFFEDWFASFRALKALVMHLLGPCSVPVGLLLAVLTVYGEELLFRGAMQPFCGLFLTSVLFGLLHMGKDGLLSAWSLWAFLAGLLIGWMYIATGSLWPCLITHFGVNAVSTLNLRRSYLRWLQLNRQADRRSDEGDAP